MQPLTTQLINTLSFLNSFSVLFFAKLRSAVKIISFPSTSSWRWSSWLGPGRLGAVGFPIPAAWASKTSEEEILFFPRWFGSRWLSARPRQLAASERAKARVKAGVKARAQAGTLTLKLAGRFFSPSAQVRKKERRTQARGRQPARRRRRRRRQRESEGGQTETGGRAVRAG